jgi:AAA15 family ATPase/GTPase
VEDLGLINWFNTTEHIHYTFANENEIIDMEKTNPIFSLKNFRSFGEEGADFELAPITVLTGCNSAGKSSLVKLLTLIAGQATGSTVDDISGKRLLPAENLKASSLELKLGGYRNILHDKNKEGKLELTYQMWSKFLNEEVICRRIYQEKKGVLNDGELKQFTIEKKDGTIVYKASLTNTILETGDGDEVVWFVDDTDSYENYFDSIRINYSRFDSVSTYLDVLRSVKRSQKICANTNDTKEYDEFLEKEINEGKDLLIANGFSVKDAEEYDIETVRRWFSVTHGSNLLALDKMYIDTMVRKEKQELREKMYYTCVINELVNPWFINRFYSIDSSTNKISRIYNVEDKDKLSALLCDIVGRCPSYKYRTGEFVNNWLRIFEIGEALEIEGTEEGLGVRVFVVDKNNRRRLLADEGCGLTQIASVLLQIDLRRNRFKKNSLDVYFEEVSAYDDSVISIEEPEIHLHPKYQSLLADLFVEAYQKYNIRFIIETHSEYLIRKLQVLVADENNSLSSNNVSLNYVEKDGNGVSTNRKIEILKDGRLSEPFGTGFLDEAKNRSMDLLHLKVIQG